MKVGRFVDFKQSREGGRVRGRKVGVERVNFILPLWSDKSIKWATDDDKNTF